MKRARLLEVLACCAALSLAPRISQAGPDSEGTFWTGYMSSWWLDESWAVWFDTHYNVDTFFVARGGITHRFDAGPRATAGYAFLLLNPEFDRHEHRAWGQVFMPWRLNENWSVSGRFRLDARWIDKLRLGEVASGYEFVLRPRLQTVLTRDLPPIRFGKPFVSAAHEILFNATATDGRDALDQNRLSLLLGLETKWVTLRLGYMHRWLPNANDNEGRHEHAAIVWFTQSVDLSKRKGRRRRFWDRRDDFPEYGGP